MHQQHNESEDGVLGDEMEWQKERNDIPNSSVPEQILFPKLTSSLNNNCQYCKRTLSVTEVSKDFMNLANFSHCCTFAFCTNCFLPLLDKYDEIGFFLYHFQRCTFSSVNQFFYICRKK
jgi:hypothetical protein